MCNLLNRMPRLIEVLDGRLFEKETPVRNGNHNLN